MKEVKDIFSKQSEGYASYRPVAPDALLEFVYSKVAHFGTAWDCGTGNGQIAARLSERFEQVYATDISEQQLEKAAKRENIIYKKERSEHTGFDDDTFDLITAAQAIHWFDFDAYYAEVRRVGKNGAVIAVWTYYTPRISEGVDKIVDNFYFNTIGNYWDKERRYIDERYQTIPFPFEEFEVPEFHIHAQWTAEQILGYLSTWSSVQHYMAKHDENPVLQIKDAIENEWENDTLKDVIFPMYMRIGTIEK
ncbi:MAG: SAM-dependent methyltransferase [Sphingobacteriales bacterium]|nr:MAG: SAM-dependent methyltransferase [Sphingobacteriales bacterium]